MSKLKKFSIREVLILTSFTVLMSTLFPTLTVTPTTHIMVISSLECSALEFLVVEKTHAKAIQVVQLNITISLLARLHGDMDVLKLTTLAYMQMSHIIEVHLLMDICNQHVLNHQINNHKIKTKINDFFYT